MKLNGFPVKAVMILSSLVLFSKTAHAYLDPGSGSYIFQILIASFLAGLYIIKLFWNKIKAFLNKLFRGKK